MGGVDTYSDRERAIRAEIERQAPDLKLKYVMEWAYEKPACISVNFEFVNKHNAALPCMKGFTTTAQTMMGGEDVQAGVVAAQLIGGARYWYEHVHPNVKPWAPSREFRDATDWASP